MQRCLDGYPDRDLLTRVWKQPVAKGIFKQYKITMDVYSLKVEIKKFSDL